MHDGIKKDHMYHQSNYLESNKKISLVAEIRRHIALTQQSSEHTDACNACANWFWFLNNILYLLKYQISLIITKTNQYKNMKNLLDVCERNFFMGKIIILLCFKNKTKKKS
jgi:hypothetical protein